MSEKSGLSQIEDKYMVRDLFTDRLPQAGPVLYVAKDSSATTPKSGITGLHLYAFLWCLE